MGTVIGIDLGTTNSCAAIVQDGKPRVISDTGGGFTIPSMVAVDDRGNRLVGQAAKRQSMVNPVNTIYGAKRLIGRRFGSDKVDEIKKQFAYKMSQGDNDDVLIKVGGEVYGLDEISALIIDKVRNTAQDILEEEITAAVVTVPAYFSDRQRQAVKDAGKIAQIEVLRIINEPTAAALAYGWGKHLHELVAIYDLGGGTFDLSILEVRDDVFEVKATGGNNFLGGVDFDNRLMDHILKEFSDATGVDITKDPMSMQRVRDACERAKIDLSTKNESRIMIPYIAHGDDGPVNLDVTVTRDQFNSMISDLADETLKVIDQVLADAKLTKDQIEDVLLVGGSTRMPYIQKLVAEYFGKQPSKNIHPDEAVALGAAIMAYSLSDDADFKITLIDVLPMSIGVALAKNKYHRIFPRNSTIPNAASIVFTTSKDNQEQLKLHIYQGENDAATENELLGDFTFSGIRPAPKGQAKIEVILRLSPEGILKVEAQDPETKQWVETTINVQSGITQKTHKTDLIQRKGPAGKPLEPTPPPESKSPTPAPKVDKTPTPPAKPKAPTPPPSPPPARPKPTMRPTMRPNGPAPEETTPPPGQGIKMVQTKSGKVVVRRDPVTGQIIKDDPDAASPQESKQGYKRIKHPPPPPTIGQKITGFFKGLFGKK